MTPRRRNTFTSLLLLGFAIVLATELLLGWLALRTLAHGAEAARTLYRHPFAVSNATGDLQSGLLQLRNHMLNLVLLQHGGPDLETQLQAAEVLRAEAEQALVVIRQQFLGDMAQVKRLDLQLLAWDRTRAAVVHALRAGDLGLAETLVRGEGTDHYNRIVPLASYVRHFAMEKGQQLALAAEAQAAAATRQLAWGFAGLLAVVVCTAALVTWRLRFLHQALDQLARVDPLTGLANRRQFMEALQREVTRRGRQATPLALAVLDVDHFKRVNDAHGHPQGDAVLQALARTSAQALRDSDLLGRLGGEEFGLLLTGASPAQCEAIVERLRAQVAAQTLPALNGGPPLAVTVSIGLALWRSGDDAALLVQRADQALYAAKATGRDRVCTAPP